MSAVMGSYYTFSEEQEKEELTRSIGLEEVLVMSLPEPEGAGAVEGGRKIKRASITATNIVASVPVDSVTFRLFTKQKSFFLRAGSVRERNEWFEAIDETAKALQIKLGGEVLTEANVCPIRVIANTMEECQICHSEFTMMARRHHCR